MKMTIDRGELISTKSDVVFVGLFEGEENSNSSVNVINDNLNKALNSLVVDGEISGTSGYSVLIHSLGLLESKRVLFIGLGDRDKCRVIDVKNAIGDAVRQINEL